ncbi:hypothetical protein A7P96_05025 [Eikenella sp. NML03-A-027]|uniref:hypothetical protein n=1 Tax=Eikenella sp. NML03-A-027 TaxID=1795828 RepID=UPI0007E093A3|nr:hypothetical protein [Eikenella sp. NML03-A-027]OAM31648.1 hypothetical protein A7P96_05025 [Eikenella sp. NML03-A-027]
MSKLLINESPLQVLPTLAIRIGLNEAIFLQQLHYFLSMSKHEKDGQRWIYNSSADWQAIFPFWSAPTIRRVIASLEEQKLIITTTQYNQSGFDKRRWFAIDYFALETVEQSIAQNEQSTNQNEQSSRQNEQSTNQNEQSYKEQEISAKDLQQEITARDIHASAVADAPVPAELEPLKPDKPKKRQPSAARIEPEAYRVLGEHGIDGQLAQDYIALRKSHRAPITQTALKGIEREANNAGLSLEQVLTICCERGWRGFRAEWLHANRGSNAPNPKPNRINTVPQHSNGGAHLAKDIL